MGWVRASVTLFGLFCGMSVDGHCVVFQCFGLLCYQENFFKGSHRDVGMCLTLYHLQYTVE